MNHVNDHIRDRFKERLIEQAKLFVKIKQGGSISPEDWKDFQESSLTLLKRIFSWEGPVSISRYDFDYSRLAASLVEFCDQDKRFQKLYFYTMLQDPSDYPEASIEKIRRKVEGESG